LDPATYHILQTLEQAQAVDWRIYPAIKVLFQTTLNAEDYEEVVRYIEGQNPNTFRADTICYATKENQEAARRLAQDPEVDLILVVGGKNSANTRHLFEICSRFKPSYFIQGAEDLQAEWFAGVGCVGLTAGASTPDYVLEEVEARVYALTGPPAGEEKNQGMGADQRV
jgi:4-hydroxy-3-methylbut-2-enyl diphosphate reductase